MSDLSDKDRKPDAATGDPAAERKRSGRVAFDARGNPIWEWQLETGVYSRDINTQKLKKLDLGDLSIAETAIHKQPPGLGQSGGKASPPPPSGGFNPYDNSSQPDHAADPYDRARALSNKLKNEPAAKAERVAAPAPRRPASVVPAPVRKPSALNRLDQWFKDRRRRKDDKDYE